MEERLTTALLHRAARLARKHLDMSATLDAAFMERYGVTYGDIDEDWLIDTLDYGNGALVNLAQCDKIMAENGHPRLSPNTDEGGS